MEIPTKTRNIVEHDRRVICKTPGFEERQMPKLPNLLMMCLK